MPMDAVPHADAIKLGFSFADLAADLAGIALATQLLDDPARLADIEKRFRVADFSLPPRGLEEGLTRKQFQKRYGSLGDARFRDELERLRKRVAALPGLAKR